MYKFKETFPRKGNILQYYKIVKQIIYSVYGLIYTAWAHITHRLSPRGYMSTNLVYESIYTVKNLYNL